MWKSENQDLIDGRWKKVAQKNSRLFFNTVRVCVLHWSKYIYTDTLLQYLPLPQFMYRLRDWGGKIQYTMKNWVRDGKKWDVCYVYYL